MSTFPFLTNFFLSNLFILEGFLIYCKLEPGVASHWGRVCFVFSMDSYSCIVLLTLYFIVKNLTGFWRCYMLLILLLIVVVVVVVLVLVVKKKKLQSLAKSDGILWRIEVTFRMPSICHDEVTVLMLWQSEIIFWVNKWVLREVKGASSERWSWEGAS